MNNQRYLHAVCSTSDRNIWAKYCRLTTVKVDYINDVVIPGHRSNTFDLQALQMQFEPSTIVAGSTSILQQHLAVNATNGSAPERDWYFNVYLSTDSEISTDDRLLVSQGIHVEFPGDHTYSVNMNPITIPGDVAQGTYWIGVRYSDDSDENPSNNDTSNDDAARITILSPTCTPTPTCTLRPTRTPVPPTVTPTRTPVPPTATPACLNDGDVIDNDVLTAADAQLAFQIALSYYSPNQREKCSADCNCDANVTSGDAQIIFQAAIGIIASCHDPVK